MRSSRGASASAGALFFVSLLLTLQSDDAVASFFLDLNYPAVKRRRQDECLLRHDGTVGDTEFAVIQSWPMRECLPIIVFCE